jgi:hypothetical protein
MVKEIEKGKVWEGPEKKGSSRRKGGVVWQLWRSDVQQVRVQVIGRRVSLGGLKA